MASPEQASEKVVQSTEEKVEEETSHITEKGVQNILSPEEPRGEADTEMTSTVEAADKAPPSAEEELAAQTEITLQPEEKDEEKVLSLEQHALENETTTTEETLEKVMFSTVEEQEDKEDEDKDVPQRKQNEEIPPAEQKSEKEKQAEVLNLNNEVVKMRKEVNRVRALIIRKLTRQISALKKKKGKDQEVQKNQRRASRLLEEIHEMKALKPDMVTKIALQRVISFDLVCKNPESTITDRAIARIVSHPQFSKKILAIKIAIEAFKDKMKGRGTKENKGKAGTQAEKGTPKFRDGKNIKDKADSVVEQTERTEGEEEDGETIDKPEEDQEKSTPTAEMTSTQNLQTPHKLTSKDRFKNAVHTKASGKSSNIKPARKDIPKAAVPKAAIKEGGSGWVGNKPEVTKKSPKPEPTPEVTQRMKDEKESATESSDEEEQSSDEEEEPLDNGAEGGFSRSDKDTKNKNMAAPKYTVVEEHVKDTPQSKVIDKRSKLKPAPEVHQGMEDESEMESSDEEEVLDDSSEECDPEESVSRSVCAAFSKATGAKDLNKNKPQSKAAGKTTGAESHQKVKDDTESDLESSDEEEEEKEYFDDSTEERFRKRSSQSESESDDDFFVGKVSKFKKKSGETRNVKSELKSNPSEPPQTLEHKPGQSQLDELASRLNSRGSSKLESLFCPSLSASNTRGGGQSWGGRGRGRGSGRDRFSSGPPKFQPRGRGGGAGFNANQYESNFRGRGGWRGREDAARQPDRREAGFLSQEPPKQALHPSWEASKKRKEQQGQIQAFQGKKIKFDDD